MTLRLKITIGSIAVVLLANALLSTVIVAYLERIWLQEVQTRVQIDLNSARAAYADHVEAIARYLTAASFDGATATLLERGDDPAGRAHLSRLFQAGTMDMLVLLDDRGRTVFRPRQPADRGDDQAWNPLVAEALRTRHPTRGTILLSRGQLLTEGDDLLARTRFGTAAADTTTTAGLAVGAAVPLLAADGSVRGVLLGGDLLDRRYELVDRIRTQVFPDAPTQDHARGNVTVFRGDLRVATNVLRADGVRAAGTRMSPEVRQRVLVEGRTWTGPAVVVHDWYITAYEPIRDPRGAVIGALYVGLPRAPFTRRQHAVTAVVLLATLIATVACILLVFFVTTHVLRPIGHVVAMAQRVIAGDLTSRTGIRPAGEMGVLCRAIDGMAAAVAEREQRLEDATRRQIGRSEKLASVGRLAAGVAHEINNPLTGVLTFAHLLRDKPKMDEEDRQDLDLIIHETTRASEIVRNLLDFARERAAIKEQLDLNEVVTRVIRLIRNQKGFDRIRFAEELAENLPPVDGNIDQLQQVLLNLALNACEAMPEGGTITIRTFARADQVVLEVGDTGCGIKREHLDLLFEPFFTTKAVGKGTGLGLAVCLGIVEQHGGTLGVESEEGKGSTFRITLPPTSGRVF
jgi:two-component system, NtrC family, sensor kinase